MLEWTTTVGDEDDPAVVLLHPAGETRHAWKPHADLLAEEFRVVTVDLPAHGIHPDADFDFERAVDDVGDILDEVGSAVLVGHSLGGYVALRAATAHETRVDGLVLAGSAHNWRSPGMLAFGSVLYLLSYVFQALSHSERFERAIAHDEAVAQPPADEDVHSSLRGTAKSMRESAYQRTWPHVEAYDGPTLVAHGDDEHNAEHAEELAARVDAELRWQQGGHLAPVHHPEDFTRLVTEFVTREG